jgi:hypothetical protein
MTEQTKRFIELSDIVGLRLTCKQCGSSLSVPRDKLSRLPVNCVNCMAEWDAYNSDDLQRKITALIDAMNVMGRLSERKGFTFTVELSPAPRADEGRASGDKG